MKNCLFCNKPLTDQKKYCSRKCKGSDHVQKYQCLACGRFSKNLKFCSDKCEKNYNPNKSKSHPCPVCGTPTKNKVNCSNKCKHEVDKEIMKGNKNPFYGKKHTKEALENNKNRNKQIYINRPEKREEKSKNMIQFYVDHPEKALEMSQIQKQIYIDHPEKRKEVSEIKKKNAKRGKDNPAFNPNKTKFRQYQIDADFYFDFKDFPEDFDFSKVNDMFHPIKNKTGYTRDHMFSRSDGYKLNIDPRIIGHPANCRLIRHSENAKKHGKSCITLEELKDRIENWYSKYAIVDEWEWCSSYSG